MLNVRTIRQVVRVLMDPLSEVLSLLRLESCASGGFAVGPASGFLFGRFQGVKCYAVSLGSCWLEIEGDQHPLRLHEGDCVLLPRGTPFCLTLQRGVRAVPFDYEAAALKGGDNATGSSFPRCTILGGHFFLRGSPSEVLLGMLPAVVHVCGESEKAEMRWALERLAKELRLSQPGSSLISQQLTYMLVIQTLRTHLHETAHKAGWLFALADPQVGKAITWMHDAPQHLWTLQELANRVAMSRTSFAQRFRIKVGETPMAYLTRWRMLLANSRLRTSSDSISEIAASLGYESDSAFGRAFKKVWGCTPREVRRCPTQVFEPSEKAKRG